MFQSVISCFQGRNIMANGTWEAECKRKSSLDLFASWNKPRNVLRHFSITSLNIASIESQCLIYLFLHTVLLPSSGLFFWLITVIMFNPTNLWKENLLTVAVEWNLLTILTYSSEFSKRSVVSTSRKWEIKLRSWIRRNLTATREMLILIWEF